jgi:hypothetical protein
MQPRYGDVGKSLAGVQSLGSWAAVVEVWGVFTIILYFRNFCGLDCAVSGDTALDGGAVASIIRI